MPVVKVYKNGAWETVSAPTNIDHPVSSVNGKTGKVQLTASDVGAESAGASLESLIEAKSYTDIAVAALVNSAPETLDTLGELATAFEENADMVAILNAAVTNKAEKTELESAQDLIEVNANNISSMQTALNKYSVETWTFTLDNGSTVTKKMVISS